MILQRDDRATSIAVSHVLTIGITVVLISLLLISTGGLLDTERERSTQASLESVGERLAGEIESVDRLAERSDDGNVNLTANHPRAVTNVGYSVTVLEADDCETELLEGNSPCLELTASSAGVTTHVPFQNRTAIDPGARASGGPIEIGYVDGAITISGARP